MNGILNYRGQAVGHGTTPMMALVPANGLHQTSVKTADYRGQLLICFFFNASLQIMPGNGKDILFWSDPWLQGSWIGDRWLDIVTAVPLRRRKKLTLEKARQGGA
jgi:hypothetical protein